MTTEQEYREAIDWDYIPDRIANANEKDIRFISSELEKMEKRELLQMLKFCLTSIIATEESYRIFENQLENQAEKFSENWKSEKYGKEADIFRLIRLMLGFGSGSRSSDIEYKDMEHEDRFYAIDENLSKIFRNMNLSLN